MEYEFTDIDFIVELFIDSSNPSNTFTSWNDYLETYKTPKNRLTDLNNKSAARILLTDSSYAIKGQLLILQPTLSHQVQLTTSMVPITN